MSSITWAGPRCVQELAAILAPQNRIQGRCDQLYYSVCFSGMVGWAWGCQEILANEADFNDILKFKIATPADNT